LQALANELKTPDSIIRELVEIRGEASKGVQAQFDAELRLAEATLALDTAEAKALLAATGTVTDRQATAKLETADLRLAEAIAKAEFNRVKTKMKVLEQAQMSVQTQARLIEMMYKGAGHGQ
jgi:hypothetical protein